MPKTCLNCGNPVIEKFCGNCGQKITVHRYSLKHFIQHDLIHGIWHIDAGILFTIRELFTRPGHSVREFINGKRVVFFNFVTLLLIIVGISHLLGEYTQIKISDLMPEDSKGTMNELEELTKKFPKTTLLLAIPFYSFFSLFWFRKSKLNLTEHFVLNSYKTVAELLIALLFTIITIFYANLKVLFIVYGLISVFSFIYAFWFYKQFFSAYGYSSKSLILRCLGVVLSYFLFSTLIGIILRILNYGE